MKNKVLVMGISALSFLFSFKNFAQVPTAAFTFDQSSICLGGTVQVTDISSEGPTAWSYTVDGTPVAITVQNPVLTFTVAGIYNITLVATNGFGDSAPFIETLTVNVLPSVVAGSSVEVCAGDFTTLNGSGASTYTWSGGVTDGVSFPPPATDIYTVAGTDGNGCKNSATVEVTVNNLPVLAVSGATGVCVASSLTLTAAGADTYTWTGGIVSDTFTDNPIVNTTYTVTGTNTLTGCSNSTIRAIAVNALPNVAVNSGSICAGKVFTMVPSGAVSYVFVNGSNTVSPTGDASYTVTGTNANGCVANAVSDVTVYSLPVLNVNSGSVCAGSSFVIVPNGALTYTILPGLNATVNPVANSSYTVTGSDNNGCVSSSGVISDVTVTPLPVFTVNSGTVCSGGIFTMNPSGSLVYSYSNGSNTVSPVSNNSYTVTGADGNGCVSLPVVSSITVVALPVISVNSGTICTGSVFTMVPGGASTYTYSSGTATVNPATTTSYSVIGTSSVGCVSTASAVADVTVFALPVISVTSGSICEGGVYTMTASGASSYTFSNGSSVVIPLTTTSYSVIGTSSNGCVATTSAVATITVSSLPVLSITSSSAICSGESLTLTVSGASTYSWSTSSTASVITESPVSNVTYSVEGTSLSGCKSAISKAIIVNSLPTITVNSGTICEGNTFIIIPGGASTYTYSGGTATVSPVSNTTYSVNGTDLNGCVSAGPAVSTVNVINAFTVTVTGNTVICEGQTTSLTANGAATYSWSNSTSGNTITLNPTTTTSYTVTGLNSNCPATAVVSVSVNALPAVTASGTIAMICSGESLTLTSTGATSYSWSNGSTAAVIVVSPTVNTTYTVTGVDANSCSNTAVIVQNVSDCTGLTKDRSDVIDVKIYPNPTNGEFTIQLSGETSVKVLNGVGQVIYTNVLAEGNTSLNIKDQPNGIYFVQFKQNNQLNTFKVVKN